MYCGECGAKLEKNVTFCGECGAKVEQNDTNKKSSTGNLKKTPTTKPVVKKEPMSKKKKICISLCAAIIIVLLLGYNLTSERLSPKGVAKDYVKALINNDIDALYGYLNLDGDKTFTSKKKFKELQEKTTNGKKITNYVIDEVTYGEGKITAKVKVRYTLKDSTSEVTDIIYLSKNSKKKYLVFDNWEIKEDSSLIIVNNYKIKVPTNSKVSLDGVTLNKKYLENDSASKNWDIYIIPQIFKSETQIKTTLPNGFELEEKIVPSSYSESYTATLSLNKLSNENKEKIETQIKKDMVDLYQNMVQSKTWDEVKETYNFKSGDLTELKDVYENLYKDIVQNENRTLKSFEITSAKITNISLTDDGKIKIYAKFDYNYTVDYKNYDGKIQTKIGNGSFSPTLYYISNDDELKLIDAAYLVSYFSTW